MRNDYIKALNAYKNVESLDDTVPARIEAKAALDAATQALKGGPKNEAVFERIRLIWYFVREMILSAPGAWQAAWRYQVVQLLLAAFDTFGSAYAYKLFLDVALGQGRSDYALLLAASLLTGEILRYHVGA